MDTIPLRCTCGKLQGQLATQPTSGRARCYCKDCQAYARFLGRQSEILDAHGGTDLIATLPAAVRFTAGLEQLACVTLTDKGPLRWYATCCRTPIGNTARDHKIALCGRGQSLPGFALGQPGPGPRTCRHRLEHGLGPRPDGHDALGHVPRCAQDHGQRGQGAVERAVQDQSILRCRVRSVDQSAAAYRRGTTAGCLPGSELTLG